MPELLGLPYSPWTEKARFALDARRVPYTYKMFSPLLGEPALRLRLRRFTGKVTVPVLTDDDGTTYADSADIARWADARGEGPRMFPPGKDAEVARFVALSERGLAAGRARSLARVLLNREALLEMVPRKARALLGPVAPVIAKLGVERTLRKYAAHRSSPTNHEAAFVAVLDELRAALGSSGGPLLGAFSFADIAAAQILAFMQPPASGLKLGRANRRAFTDDDLRSRYADLVAWRDALYAAHRPTQ